MSDQVEEWGRYQAEAVYWHEQRIQSSQRTISALWKIMVMAIALCVCLVAVIMYLLCHDKWSVVVIHHRSDNSVWVSQALPKKQRVTRAEEEGNLAQYVRARESYSASAYAYQYDFVKLASTESVYRRYANQESYHRSNSRVRQDGGLYYRSVRVHDVMFMPTVPGPKRVAHKQDPMADVSYQLCRHSLSDGSSRCVEKHALLAWHYRGMPSDPHDRWLNWRGFTVSYYQTVVLTDKQANQYSVKRKRT